MYNGPWGVSGIVNRTYGINLALGISGIAHTNIKKLKCYNALTTTLLEESALIYYQIQTSAHQNDREDHGIILWFR